MINHVWRMPEKGHLILSEEAMPDAEYGKVIVKLEYCGICGSDIHFFINGAIGIRKAPDNFILGHECAGTVVECGPGVEKLKLGDRVALEPGIPCGKCEYCKKGLYNLCPDVHFLAAAAPPTDGALREYISYPEEYCFKLPDEISTLEGCMIEPLAVGIHAAARGCVEPGKTVAIIGTGTIGYMTLLASKARGADKIIVSDALDNRLEAASAAGADVLINAVKEDTEQVILQHTNGQGCDVVFETAGIPGTLAATWKYVKRGGVIVNVGNAGGEVPYLFGELARKEADIRHVWRYRHVFPIAIESLKKGTISLKNVDPRIFPFEKSEEAFRFAFEQRSTVLKTVIKIQ